MGDKKGWGPKMCGNCGRITRRDLARGFCPFTASRAYANKPADRCVLYTRSGSGGAKSQRSEDVSEE